MSFDKWSEDNVKEIDEHLRLIKTPREIHRDARSLYLFRIWKGHEFRNFLCYYGCVVLRRFLPHKHYRHFLKLFCAFRMASCEKLVSKHVLIEKLFQRFVEEFKRLYGAQFMFSNIHNILHIIDDVKRFGVLPSISAYPFESTLGRIKSTIRAGQCPMAQIARRLVERCNVFERKSVEVTKKRIEYHTNETKCRIIRYPERSFELSSANLNDSWFFAHGKIMKMVDGGKITENNDFYVEAIAIIAHDDFFLYPFRSSLIQIFQADITNCGIEKIKVFEKDIVCKFVCIKESVMTCSNNHVFLPILHTHK